MVIATTPTANVKSQRVQIDEMIAENQKIYRVQPHRAAAAYASTPKQETTIQFDAKLFDKIAPTTENYHLNAINTRNESHKSYFTRTKLLLV